MKGVTSHARIFAALYSASVLRDARDRSALKHCYILLSLLLSVSPVRQRCGHPIHIIYDLFSYRYNSCSGKVLAQRHSTRGTPSPHTDRSAYRASHSCAFSLHQISSYELMFFVYYTGNSVTVAPPLHGVFQDTQATSSPLGRHHPLHSFTVQAIHSFNIITIPPPHRSSYPFNLEHAVHLPSILRKVLQTSRSSEKSPEELPCLA